MHACIAARMRAHGCAHARIMCAHARSACAHARTKASRSGKRKVGTYIQLPMKKCPMGRPGRSGPLPGSASPSEPKPSEPSESRKLKARYQGRTNRTRASRAKRIGTNIYVHIHTYMHIYIIKEKKNIQTSMHKLMHAVVTRMCMYYIYIYIIYTYPEYSRIFVQCLYLPI